MTTFFITVTLFFMLVDDATGTSWKNICQLDRIGFYYGISPQIMEGFMDDNKRKKGKGRISSNECSPEEEYENIAEEVKKWSKRMLEENDDSWKKVECNVALKRVFNPSGETKQWVKWMKDSRGEKYAYHNDNQYHPCMKLRATINAPFDLVCRYLSQGHRLKEYNSLLIDQKDLEEISPHSKICWSQTKKLLFIQPRDFVTFCHHRWFKDGTQLVVNQACDHPSMPDSDGGLRAFSLRGATFISKHPNPEKTTIVMLAHCNCGRDIPEWGVRAAVKVLAPIKPFEIIYRINKGVMKSIDDLRRAESVSRAKSRISKENPDSRSLRPAGIAQMGYACYWPDGGGLIEE